MPLHCLTDALNHERIVFSAASSQPARYAFEHSVACRQCGTLRQGPHFARTASALYICLFFYLFARPSLIAGAQVNPAKSAARMLHINKHNMP